MELHTKCLLLLLCYLKIANSKLCICSDQELSNNTELLSCCGHLDSTCHQSFEFDSGQIHINNNTLISLCEVEFSLGAKVSFDNLHHVSLTGHPNGTSITCTNSQDAGIEITGSRSVHINNIHFKSCAMVHHSSSNSAHRRSSVYIAHSFDIKLHDVSILVGVGGLFILNSYGNITGCNFHKNKAYSDSSLVGGGAMHVEFTSSETQGMSNYSHKLTINHCMFTHNDAFFSMYGREIVSSGCENKLGRGGGLALYLAGKTTETVIEISDVEFKNNRALWGGGMYVHFCDQAVRNQVLMQRVTFFNNTCELYGGGGVDVGFTFSGSTKKNVKNLISFNNCTFEQNRAFLGGGVAVYSTEESARLNNTVHFFNCCWIQNSAYYGAALDIAPKLIAESRHGFIRVNLTNAVFKGNRVLLNESLTTKDRQQGKCSLTNKRVGSRRGTLLVAGQTLYFDGFVEFTNNTGSAIYAVSTTISLAAGTTASFIGNVGLHGGAIALIGYSVLQVDNNVTVSMEDNSALTGGAIYHETIDSHDYLFSRNCFIRHPSSKKVEQRYESATTEFKFAGNSAGHNNNSLNGNSIFATTLLPCIQYCGMACKKLTLSEIFKCIGDFQSDDGDHPLVTMGAYFTHNFSEPFLLIPGKRTEIPFSLMDDLDQEVHGIYHITTESSNISIDSVHTHTSGNVIVLGGNPGTRGKILLTKIPPREVTLQIEVELQQCPPFFLYNRNFKSCQCAQDQNAEYINIRICNNTSFESDVLHGYWVGYERPGEERANKFMYGICPSLYCFQANESQRYHRLPSNEEVEEAVCGDTRSGILCGECRNGSCAHYHSQTFKCGSCKLCKFGWIFYFISEIIPLTVLFLVVMVFNIRFTAGFLNGFIFFAQVFDSVFSTNGKVFVFFPEPVYKLIKAITVIYKLFNFNFLAENELSYCLWEKARTIHLLAFKFSTVAIAGVLVVITVLTLKRCANSKRLRCCTKSVSMIHGLSAFLVMVYTQCTNISFQLLNYTIVYDLHGKMTRVLFYQGDTKLFSKENIPFLILAILCLSTMTLIPPLFLISYPLCNRIASCLRLDNTILSKLLGKLFPLSKLKPVFDSFQGCYKDNYRHFAGLYFVYRVGLLATVLFSDPTLTYAYTQLQLVLMLTVHCICWPYIKRVHNIIDALFFCILCIINIITIMTFNYGHAGSVYQKTINIATYIQLLFIYAPLVYLVAIGIYSAIKLCNFSAKSGEAEDEIAMERLDSSTQEASVSYKKLLDTY